MRFREFVPLLCCLIGFVLPGCEQNHSRGVEDLPTMDAVKSRNPVYGQATRKAKAAASPTRPTLRVYKLDMPVRASTADGWALVDQEAFPKITRGVWQSNGIRIGVMASHRLEELRQQLPRITAVSQSKTVAADQFTPLISAGRLPTPIRVDLTVPPRPVREEVVDHGRLRMLIRASPGRSGVVVELVPHQYVPRLSLEPRSAQKKMLDGRLFDRLALNAALARGQMLVIGLDRPWEEKPKADESSQTDNGKGDSKVDKSNEPSNANAKDDNQQGRAKDQQGEDREQNKDEHALPPIGHNLGRALLTRRRASQPLQTILLIELANP